MLTIKDFYRDERVIKRMLEYCGVPQEEVDVFRLEGGKNLLSESATLREISKRMTVEYVSEWIDDPAQRKEEKVFDPYSSKYTWQLGELLDGGKNVFRSLWDKENLTFLLDMEYMAIPLEEGGLPRIGFQESLEKVEPTYWCVKEVLGRYGIEPFILTTGRGYHFIFNVPSYVSGEVTEIAQELTEIGHMEKCLEDKYKDLSQAGKRKRAVEPELGKAYDSIGKLMEFVVHEVAKKLPDYGSHLILRGGEEGVADFDLSPYYDPIYMRIIRMAFSAYTKHKDKGIDHWNRNFPEIVSLPRFMPEIGRELDLGEILESRISLEKAVELAGEVKVEIPKYTEEVRKLLRDYKCSELFSFHENFAKELDTSSSYPELRLEELPGCLKAAVINPEPNLRHIAVMQNLVRVLGSKGWSMASVANLVRERYGNIEGETRDWVRYDAKLCGKVVTRFYGGLFELGIDDKADLDCGMQQRKGYCVGSNCKPSLDEERLNKNQS